MKLRPALVRICLQMLAATVFVGGAVAADKVPAQNGDFDSASVGDLPAATGRKLKNSVKRFLTSPGPASSRSAGELGWDCLAASALLDGGEKLAAQKLQSIAQLLSDKAVRSGGGILGWGYEGKSAGRCADGELDAFGDGTCNAKNTVYSFQTGLGIACLAKAGVLLKNEDFVSKARQSLGYWQGYAVAAKPCAECIYYLYSDSPNDRGRYVRNVNVFMAYGAAVLAKAMNDPVLMRLANRAMHSELDERRAGNEGYLGRLDPQWIARRADASQNIENHAATIAVLSDQIGVLTASQEMRNHGLAVWEKWAACDNKRCRAASCKFWGGDATKCQATLTAAHCAFRKRAARASAQCDAYLSRVKSVQSFGIWSAIVGGTGQ